MIFKTVTMDSLVFAGIVNLYLFLMMITTSPRVWGYSDYPDVVKDKVLPPTRKEKRTALLVGLPWIAFVLVYPFVASLRLKAGLGGNIQVELALTMRREG